MAKAIKYKFMSAEVNHGTDDNPDIEQFFADKAFTCNTQDIFDANYPIAEKEAVGEIIVEGEFDPESEPAPTPTGEPVTWDDLDAAYQEGVDSV